MSTPSASCCVQMGVMDFKAAWTSRQEEPSMEYESSIRKMVSKEVRKAYWSSGVEAVMEEKCEGLGLEVRGAKAAWDG